MPADYDCAYKGEKPWNVIGKRTLKNATAPMSPAPEKGSVASVLRII